MASTDGLVQITRGFFASYYEKYHFPPLPDDVASLSSQIRSLSNDLISHSPPTDCAFLAFFSSVQIGASYDDGVAFYQEREMVEQAENNPPHKIDENMWKNREMMEEIVFMLEKSHWPPS